MGGVLCWGAGGGNVKGLSLEGKVLDYIDHGLSWLMRLNLERKSLLEFLDLKQ